MAGFCHLLQVLTFFSEVVVSPTSAPCTPRGQRRADATISPITLVFALAQPTTIAALTLPIPVSQPVAASTPPDATVAAAAAAETSTATAAVAATKSTLGPTPEDKARVKAPVPSTFPVTRPPPKGLPHRDSVTASLEQLLGALPLEAPLEPRVEVNAERGGGGHPGEVTRGGGRHVCR